MACHPPGWEQGDRHCGRRTSDFDSTGFDTRQRCAAGGHSSQRQRNPTPDTPGASPNQVALGERIFEGQAAGGTCAGCHGTNGKGTGMGSDLTSGKWLWGNGSIQAITRAIALMAYRSPRTTRARCRPWAAPSDPKPISPQWQIMCGRLATRSRVELTRLSVLAGEIILASPRDKPGDAADLLEGSRAAGALSAVPSRAKLGKTGPQ